MSACTSRFLVRFPSVAQLNNVIVLSMALTALLHTRPGLTQEVSNLIQNGSFSLTMRDTGAPSHWYNLCQANREAKEPGNFCMFLSSSAPERQSHFSQSFPLDGRMISTVALQFQLRYENVLPGDWIDDLPDARINFIDENYESAGAFRIPAWRGTQGWSATQHLIAIPDSCREARLTFDMNGATGAVFVDDVFLQPTGMGVEKVEGASSWQPDHSGWFPVTSLDTIENASALDFSSLLDTPAGKHGWLKDDARFADDTPARFFGVTLHGPACFPSKERAARRARRLASLGINLVRLYGLDSFAHPTRCLFPSASRDTRSLSPENLDLLDYFVHQLKSRGIYCVLSLNSHRRFREEDGIADFQLLPPGGGFAVLFDEAIVRAQITSAKQLLSHRNPYTRQTYLGDPVVVGIEWNQSLTDTGAQNLGERHRSVMQAEWIKWLREEYRTTGCLAAAWSGRNRESELRKGESIERATVSLPPDLGVDTSHRAIEARRFLRERRAAYADRVQNHLAGGAPARSVLFVDEHGSPNVPEDVSGFSIPERALFYQSPIVAVGLSLLSGKAAVFAGSIHNDPDPWGDHVPGAVSSDLLPCPYDASNAWPQALLQWPIAASMFHRPSPGQSTRNIAQSFTFDEHARIFTVAVDRVEAVGGYLQGKEIRLRTCRFQIDTGPAVIAVSSVGNEPLGVSRRLLITALSGCEPSGVAYASHRRLSLTNTGRSPFLSPPVEATIYLPWHGRGTARVYVLDMRGRRRGSLEPELVGDSLIIHIDRATHYEVVSAR